MSNTRRSFLAGSGAAVVYKLGGPAFAMQAAAANDQIGLGFIGTGIRGTQLLDDFKKIPGVRPVVVADLYDGYLQRAKEQTEGSIETTKDYHAVLSRKDVDAVVIATPDHWHKKMVLDALAAGKHVYIEKPLTWSVEEGREIMAAVQRSGKLVQVGSQGKTSPLTAKAREIVKSGALGKVTMIRMANHRNNAQGAWAYPIPPDASPKTIDWAKFLGPAEKRPFDPAIFFRWRCWWDFSGGVATDLFVHLLTWLHEVMDVKAPTSIVSLGGLYFWKDGREVPDVMNSIFEYEEGFVADMYVHLANSRSVHGIVIMGTEGTLVEERGGLTVYPEPVYSELQQYGSLAWPKQMRAAYFEKHGYTPEGRPKNPAPAAKKPQEISIDRGPSHYELFILSMREGSPSKETAAEGHYAAGAAHLANKAYREGKQVNWDYKNGKIRES